MKRHRRADCFATKTINNQGVAAEKPLFSEGQSRKSRQLHVRFESQRLLQCARHGSAWRNLSGRITTRERRDTATKRYPSFRQVRFNGACGSTKRQVAARRAKTSSVATFSLQGMVHQHCSDSFRDFELSLQSPFSPFAHATCALSVSHRYSKPCENYISRVRAPFSRSFTREWHELGMCGLEPAKSQWAVTI